MRRWWRSLLKREDGLDGPARSLCDSAVHAARAPELYVGGLAEDDFDGRWGMLSLHAALLMRRLKTAGPPGLALSERFSEALFDRVDYALREDGVGDATIARRVRGLAEHHYGLARALDTALEEGQAAIAAVLVRNGLGGADALALARHAAMVAKALSGQADTDLLAGQVTWS